MKAHLRLLAAILALCLCAAATALAAGLDDPKGYVGVWGGGDDYGETREYYLEILDYKDGVYTANLSIFRIWSFEGMTALLTEEGPSAVLSTRADDDYTVLAALDFGKDSLHLTVLESDFLPDLPEGTEIDFVRSEFN